MSLKSLHREFQPYAEAFVNAVKDAGVPVQVTSTTRSYASQSRLYRDYIEGRSRIPAAPPGTSLHEWGLAFDMSGVDSQTLAVLGRLWEDLGLGVWGGRFKDPIHFEANAAVKKAAGWAKGKSKHGPGISRMLEKVGGPTAKEATEAAVSTLEPWWLALGRAIFD